MREEHRPKHELIHEITGLRKQVVDLKDAMSARRRVEDALRQAETLLRALTDGAPVGLCLFQPDGTVLTANRPFARMLGYDSPAELQSLSAVIGVFDSPEERSRALDASGQSAAVRDAWFRRKDGCRRSHPVLPGRGCEGQPVTLAVFDSNPNHLDSPFPAPPA
jgi:PAS domain S-box-containing protein